MTRLPAGRNKARAPWEFRLYVAGRSPRSVSAYANLKRLCDERLAGRYSIEVFDLLEKPALARADNIVAIPTLVRRRPTPVRVAIGDFSDPAQTASVLRLEQGA